MSYYAFLDIKKTSKITADTAFSQYGKSKKNYYCPNYNCPAKMTLKSRNGERTHYFAALKSTPHINNCEFLKNHFYKEDFDESTFSLDALFDELSSLSKKTNHEKIKNRIQENHCESVLKRIKTIGQLYSMCINTDIDDEYNNTEIWKILIDERSEHIYKNGIFDGLRLIKCKYVSYDKNNCLIYLKSCNRFDLKIHICNEIFSIINSAMYKLKNSNGNILVFGNWQKSGKYYFSEITSEKQYKILR